MKRILENIIEDCKKWTTKGEVASYIPELTKADSNALGIWVTTLSGEEYFAGDC
ncbi:MAG: glutaminase, partial [Clostridia bacterium]